MRRRDFLGAAGGALAAMSLPRTARAAWGDAPASAASTLLQPGTRAERCLELFLYGGLATYESFYVAPDYGRADDANAAWRNTQWHLFEDDHAEVFSDCGFGPESGWLTPFAPDANGTTVHLGPMVRAFAQRPDLLARMRIVVLRHDLAPHEAAIPLATTGLRLGNPRMAGLGTHIQRYHVDRDTTGRTLPYSYVLAPTGDDPTFNVGTAIAVGQHPGYARPLQFATSSSMVLTELLGRGRVGDDAARVDPLLSHYLASALSRYTDPLTGAALRAKRLDDHAYALSSLIHAPDLASLLGGDLFTATSSRTCGSQNVSDASAMSIRAAVSLLTHPTTPARYVDVVDGGALSHVALAYDTHGTHLRTHTENQHHLLSTLAERINLPGEGDPTKLDLDDTLVVLNAEFGRTPYAQFAGGTNHHPYGYVAVLLGGPVEPGVYGAIGPDGNAEIYATPAELKASCLAALGMYPFSAEGFAVGDLQSAYTELDGLEFLHQALLGRV